MRTLLLDIETAPLGWHEPFDAEGSLAWTILQEVIEEEGQKSPPKNYKKPETIAKWRAERQAELAGLAHDRWQRCSLDSLRGQVVTVGLHDMMLDDTRIIHNPRDEREVLDQLRVELGRVVAHESREDRLRVRLVAHNGSQFDFPFLAHRLRVHGFERLASHFIQIHYGVERALKLAPSVFQLVDTQDLLRMSGSWGLMRFDTPDLISADPLAARGGGAAVLQALMDGRDEEVAAHCRVDLERLRRLWNTHIYSVLQHRGLECLEGSPE